MPEWFTQYSQKQRSYLKIMLRRIYQDNKKEIDRMSGKNRNVELANIFLKYVDKPPFYREDMETLKDIFLYSEWIIEHWKVIESDALKESIQIQYKSKAFIERIDRLRERIEKLKEKKIRIEELPEEYRKMITEGKTPDKIRLEKLNERNLDKVTDYVKKVEGATN